MRYARRQPPRHTEPGWQYRLSSAFDGIDGFKSAGYKYSYLNAAFIQRVLGFSCDHYQELRTEQENIENIGGVRYPVMKLVDMYFWQIGFDRAGPASRSEGDET